MGLTATCIIDRPGKLASLGRVAVALIDERSGTGALA